MEQAAEKNVLSTLYDRLFDAISYAPNPTGVPIDRTNTRLMMAKNFVLNPADFTNAASPLNPASTSNFVGAKAFSDLVDPLPGNNVEWISSGNTLSSTYADIVNGANTSAKIDPAQQAIYDKAYKYLNQQTSIANFDGSVTTSYGPSQIALTYNDNQSAYIAAIGGYRIAQNGYDLSQQADQRAWNAAEPMLANNVSQTWNKWVREGKANVEQAQSALSTSINNAIAYAIEEAQARINDAHKQAPLQGNDKWLLSYGQSTNWMDPSSTASQLKLSSSRIATQSSAEATSYSASAQGSWGLWSAGGSHSYSEQKSSDSMQASHFDLSAELIQVRIMRPWYNPLLFSMKNWRNNAFPAHSIPGTMPWVATSFVVARNVTISADFSSADKEHFSSQTQSSASVGWGPFAVSGSYSHSESKDNAKSTFDSGGLHLPGLQVVGFVCSRTPDSPPQ